MRFALLFALALPLGSAGAGTAAGVGARAATGTAAVTAAGVVPAPQPTDGLERWVRESVKLPDGQNLRIEIQVGVLDRRVKLPSCDRAEPFLPRNARLWGRANVGLRCVAGASWTTFIPVRIAAWGPALVARVPLPAGRIPQPEDFSVREVDWAASRSTPIANRALLEDQELIRPVAAGQPILAEYLRISPAVRAGEPVAVVVQGTGFAIRTEAIALATAAEGQPVKVRTASGKVLNGTIEGKSVRILR